MRSVPLLLLILVACSRAPDLETRTFDLQYLAPEDAGAMIDPYVYDSRDGAPGRITMTRQTLTVRETAENLDRIAEVLAQYDKPKPWVRLHFQLIEADGARTADPRIAEVEAELKKLFRFTGYRLLTEAVLSGTARSSVSQTLGEAQNFAIGVDITDVRTINDTGIVSMNVQLRSQFGTGLGSQINAREGQTVVLGNTRMGEGARQTTVILTVRPELVRG
jgi:type II secretory pathway component GspD/PulD (secretin)